MAKLIITDIECHVLLVPDVDETATSSAQDDIIVFVHTNLGFVGVGESDVNPWMAKATIEAPSTHTMGMSLKEALIGEDPRDTERLWDKMYAGSAMNGRRGVVIHCIGALDMALWDIKGKAAGKPVWQLLEEEGLGKKTKDYFTPYASLQPNGDSYETYKKSLVEWAVKAKQLGFSAAKLECTLCGPYAHSGLWETDGKKVTEVVRACREAVGKDFTLMVDVQYCWADAQVAIDTLKEWDDLDIFFVETPIRMDQVADIRKVKEGCSVRVAYGEWQATRWEFEDLLDRGKIDVAQPDVGRVGGLTEAMRVCKMAADRGRLIVPHCWKTGVGIAASAHLAAVTPHCPYIEFLPAELTDSALRKELTIDELELKDGRIALPQKPGLGVEINMDALRRFSVNASRCCRMFEDQPPVADDASCALGGMNLFKCMT